MRVYAHRYYRGDSVSREIAFTDTGKLRVLAVPIQGRYGGDIVSPGSAWKQAGHCAKPFSHWRKMRLNGFPTNPGGETATTSCNSKVRITDKLREELDSGVSGTLRAKALDMPPGCFQWHLPHVGKPETAHLIAFSCAGIVLGGYLVKDAFRPGFYI